jgi:hypothetical protein
MLLTGMRSRNFRWKLPRLSLLVALFISQPVFSQEYDHSLYDGLLRSYVNSDGLVNYAGLKRDSMADLEAYLNQLADTNLKSLKPEERLPFWVNAFNVYVIKQVLDQPALRKIDQEPQFFNIPHPIAGGTYTLNDILHRILRGQTNPVNQEGPIPGVTLPVSDPRVHFVLAYGTIDSPRLQNVAYTGGTMEAALREGSIAFANSPEFLKIEGRQLHVCRVMKWYGEDFTSWGGPAAYLTRLVDPAKRKDAAQIKKLLASDYAQATFYYDWTVNDIRQASTKRPKLLRSPK